jgi:hypothetical protein
MILNDKTYDILKWFAQIALPAIAVFWYAIATVWKIPYAKEIQTTIIAIDTLLGALLHKASKDYHEICDFSGIPLREDNSDEG